MHSYHEGKPEKPSHNSHKHSAPSSSAGSNDLIANTYEQLKKGREVTAAHAEHHQHPAQLESIRDVEYNGHQIVIRTHYDIKVDGKPFTVHVYVDNAGMVSTHALPAYSFASTVDLVKNLIDAFPNNFEKKKTTTRPRG